MNKIRFLDVLKRFFPLMVIFGVLLVVASYEIRSQNQTSGRPIGIQTPLSPEFSRLLLQLDETSHEGNFLRGIEGVEVSFVITEIAENLYKISFRSRKKYIINDIAGEFGGGGHALAAGATVQTSDVEKLTNDIIFHLEKRITNGN
ncbi:MAG: DHHA1 domain-containing protein [Planctomycetes bacterium]|nr:DHHA1 domain-containing protein [Planctomycetota bacterium]